MVRAKRLQPRKTPILIDNLNDNYPIQVWSKSQGNGWFLEFATRSLARRSITFRLNVIDLRAKLRVANSRNSSFPLTLAPDLNRIIIV